MKEQFAKAGLRLEIHKSPLAPFRGEAPIFQMDIQRKLTGGLREEVFRIYPADAKVQVMGVDKKIEQLVLSVKEDRHEFFVPVPYGIIQDAKMHEAGWKERIATTMRVRTMDIGINEGRISVKQTTSAASRYFLLGKDERFMFIAQLPQHCTTVKEAHACLKNPVVTTAEGRVPGRTVRQGEWFFMNMSVAEESALKAGLKNKSLSIQRKAPIEAGRAVRNKHIAEELVTTAGRRLEHGHPVLRRDEIFVRGAVRHPEHGTVKFKSWRRCVRNMEGSSGATGIGWID